MYHQAINIGSDEKAQTILEWLSSLRMHQTQQDIYSRHQDGTGEWFLKEAAFLKWMAGESLTSTLWCPGNRKV